MCIHYILYLYLSIYFLFTDIYIYLSYDYMHDFVFHLLPESSDLEKPLLPPFRGCYWSGHRGNTISGAKLFLWVVVSNIVRTRGIVKQMVEQMVSNFQILFSSQKIGEMIQFD